MLCTRRLDVRAEQGQNGQSKREKEQHNMKKLFLVVASLAVTILFIASAQAINGPATIKGSTRKTSKRKSKRPRTRGNTRKRAATKNQVDSITQTKLDGESRSNNDA
jgi:hypothetical protein